MPGALDFPGGGLANFFTACFDEYVRLERVPCWRTLFNTAWCYDDGVFLENRLGAMLGGVELLIRTSFEEAFPANLPNFRGMNFRQTIDAARTRLGWDTPEHYTASGRYSESRDAIRHAKPLPCTSREALDLLLKWGLFLYRRLLIRLGYSRPIQSASRGCSSMSDVGDFSEGQNSFLTSRE